MAAAVVAAVAAFVALAPLADVVGWVAIAMAAMVVGTLAWRNPEVRAPLLVALALRTAATLVQFYLVPLPGSGMDTVTFELLGWNWAQGGWRGLAASFTTGPWLYSWIIAVLYWIGARSALMVQVLNVLLGTLVVFNVFRITTLLWGGAAARRAAWWVACFPTMILFSALLLREAFVAYPFTLGVLCFLRWYRSNSFPQLAGSVACLVVATIFHFGMAGALLAVGAMVSVRALSAVWRGRAQSPLVAVTIMGAAAVAATGVVLFAAARVNYLVLLSATDVVAAYQAGTNMVDRTDYLSGMVVSSPLDVLWQAPIRFVFFQFMPFPWLVRAAADLFGLLDAGLYGFLVFCAWRGRDTIRRSAEARSVFWVWVACVLVYGLLVSNYGTAIRHRGKMAPVLIAVAAAGMLPRRPRTAE